MKVKKQRNDRSKMIVDINTQGIIVRKAIGHWVLFTCASLLISGIIHFCRNPFGSWEDNAIEGLKSFAPVLATLACLGPVFVYDFLRLSNRIFGPIPRIRRMIRTLADGGEVNLLKTRKDDSHAELISDINLLVQMIIDTRVVRVPEESQASPTPVKSSDVDESLARDVQTLLQLLRASQVSPQIVPSVSPQDPSTVHGSRY
ncbi:hypothetical protein [Neorhodopirellula pilleata]|uniref:HAMP domain-containing protein n=1 Tax=Neorhodopirellula pilleata TaxID=2714738 RepID=A0A5C5ZG74_9BACT|nr:hypothetical protein [Neorhodopirellula pilleata]TWT86057.1 hypothetical protein Pla100_62470 [Neorhodopirellula pilleata]